MEEKERSTYIFARTQNLRSPFVPQNAENHLATLINEAIRGSYKGQRVLSSSDLAWQQQPCLRAEGDPSLGEPALLGQLAPHEVPHGHRLADIAHSNHAVVPPLNHSSFTRETIDEASEEHLEEDLVRPDLEPSHIHRHRRGGRVRVRWIRCPDPETMVVPLQLLGELEERLLLLLLRYSLQRACEHCEHRLVVRRMQGRPTVLQQGDRRRGSVCRGRGPGAAAATVTAVAAGEGGGCGQSLR